MQVSSWIAARLAVLVEFAVFLISFSEVQAIVNQRAGVGAARVYTVKSGDTLSEIGASLGIDWHTIASKNGIGAPYTIYPGQKLSY